MKDYITTVLGFFVVWATGMYLLIFPEKAMWVGLFILLYAVAAATYLLFLGMYYYSQEKHGNR